MKVYFSFERLFLGILLVLFSSLPSPAYSFEVIQTIIPMGISLDVQNPRSDFSMIRKNVDSYGYAYAPTTLFDQKRKKFFRYFCSSPGSGINNPVPVGKGWDYLRMVWSSDGVNWSLPKVVVYPQGTTQDLAACDPSVVQYQEYFYLFYSSWRSGDETINVVARSLNPEGPFEIWSDVDSGRWIQWPSNQIAKPIQLPIKKDAFDQVSHPPTNRSNYGLGQPTVLVLGDELHMWYTDDSKHLEACAGAADGALDKCKSRTFFAITKNPVAWPSQPKTQAEFAQKNPRIRGVETDLPLGIASVDVKYDPVAQRFVMFAAGGGKANSSILMYTSKNGYNWSPSTELCYAKECPPYIGEIGATGDESGHLINGGTVISMKAANDLSSNHDEDNRCNNAAGVPHCFGFWDLYDVGINLQSPFWNKTVLALAKKQSVKFLNVPPSGQVDAESSLLKISGWALDPDAPAQDVEIHIFDEVGIATYSGIAIKAALPRTEGGRRFEYLVPKKYDDGKPHTFFIYAIDNLRVKNRWIGTVKTGG